MLASRRSFVTGLVSFIAAPAIIRAGSLMPVKVMVEPIEILMPPYGWSPLMGNLEDLIELDKLHRQIAKAYGLQSDWFK